MGVHDTYCVICGIPTSGLSWNNLDDLIDIINAGEFRVPNKNRKGHLLKKTHTIPHDLLLNYSNFVNDVIKLRPKFKWIDNKYLITNSNVIKNIKGSGDYGEYYYENEHYETQKFLWNQSNRALICHKSCYKLLHNKFNYKLEIDDIQHKLNGNSMLSNYGSSVEKYVGYQDFPLMSMILNSFSYLQTIMEANKKLEIDHNNVNFLFDPLKNDENEKRILNIWKPIIKQIKSRTNSKPKSKRKKVKNSKPKSKRRHLRPSPSDSATLFKLGHKEKGNDGNIYIVTETKNNVKRWTKISNN